MISSQDNYSFQEVAAFDARQGMRRCTVPGVGMGFATSGRHANTSNADFWRHRDDAIMVRVSWMGYVWSFRALLSSGEPIPEEAVGELGQFFAALSGVEWFNSLGESVSMVTGLIFVICVLTFRSGIMGELTVLIERARAWLFSNGDKPVSGEQKE